MCVRPSLRYACHVLKLFVQRQPASNSIISVRETTSLWKERKSCSADNKKASMSSEHCARVKCSFYYGEWKLIFVFLSLALTPRRSYWERLRAGFHPRHVLSVRRPGLSAYGCMPLLADKIGLLRRKLINKRIWILEPKEKWKKNCPKKVGRSKGGSNFYSCSVMSCDGNGTEGAEEIEEKCMRAIISLTSSL